jgi:hypothetical protein
MEKKPWFGPKRFGWGLGPQTWQGWLLVGVVVAGIVIFGAAVSH